MKYFAVLVILAGLAFPVFAQNSAITQRFNALSESMGTTVSKSSSILEDFDSQIKDNKDVVIYTNYVKLFNFLASELQESEQKLNLMLRSNDRAAYIAEERDNYESIIKRLQAVKSDFDAYIKSR
jgi:hypothetical protein